MHFVVNDSVFYTVVTISVLNDAGLSNVEHNAAIEDETAHVLIKEVRTLIARVRCILYSLNRKQM